MPKKNNAKSNSKYPGQLGSLMNPNEYSATDLKTIHCEITEKMDELKRFYEIDPNSPESWASLAKRLACAHVPGFQFKQIEKIGGRPKRKISTDRKMYLKIHLFAKESGKSISNACEILLREFSNYKSSRSLNSRYHEIKKQLKDDPEYKAKFLNAGIIYSVILKQHID